jgi:hypothetical protein
MLLDFVRFVLATALLVVLPGVLVVNAAFPRSSSQIQGFERTYLSVALGLLTLILVAVGLGSIPHEGRGYFQSSATGAPYLELAMLAVCLTLLYIGLVRGAYPGTAARFPRVAHPHAPRRAQRELAPHMR